ncbi:hypothetical protein AX17_002903 [Amanita inopinata Kibby_2008]|nr:hypothetical protein AX17_002903 [Amanita inopinata Kibby_2008]
MSSISHLLTLNDGNKLPWLAFGTGTALYGRDAASAIELAIRTGMIHLDGAQAYNNEQSLGAGIKASGKSRDELYIVTKLSEDTPIQSIRPSLVGSLEKLGIDHVDLFLVHSPHGHNSRGTLPAVWKEMEEIKKAGLSKSIGVSNFRVEDLKVILQSAEIVPAVNQIEFHPYVWKAAEPLMDFCRQHGIVIASYGGQSPIARSPGGPLDSVLATVRERVEKTRGQPVTVGQILTKWIKQKGAIVVTTSTKEFRIKEFMDTEDVPDLTPEEIKEIETSGSGVHKRFFMHNVFME